MEGLKPQVTNINNIEVLLFVVVVLPPVLVPPQVHNDIPIERPSLDEYELPANANYPVGPEPVMALPLSLPGDYCVHHILIITSCREPSTWLLV